MRYYSLAKKLLKERDEYIQSLIKDMSLTEKELYLKSEEFNQLIDEYDVLKNNKIKQILNEKFIENERIQNIEHDLRLRYNEIVNSNSKQNSH
jgi:hypothetical protein